MNIIAQDTSRNNTIFKVDPEFRDKIPPMPVEDFEGLKADILRDGYVRDPLVVWDEENILLDGHHRWRVIQEHPELPYTIDRKSFLDRWAAIAWICANQLHRHNLGEMERIKLMHEEYEATQKSSGGQIGNKNAEKRGDEIHHFVSGGNNKTRKFIAHEHGVSEHQVQTAVEVGRGIDKAAEVDPDFKRDVLSGVVKAKKSDLAAIRKLESEEDVKAAVEAIRNPPPKPHKPKAPADPEAAAKRAAERELKERIHEIAEDMRKTDIAAYTQTDLERDLTLITERAVRDIRQELTIRKKSITDTEALIEILVACERELAEVETELAKGVYAK